MKFQLLGASSPEESARERAHRAIAREAAAEGIVLLENNGVLPMQPQKIALYGAGSRMTVKGGSGSGDVHERYSVTIEEGLKNAGFAFPTTLWMDRFQEKYEADIAAWRQGLEKQVQKYSPVQTMQMFIFIGEHPIPYPACTPVLADELTDETDTAIYVLSRQAGEGKDRRVEKGDYLLSNVETESLRLLRKHYKKYIWKWLFQFGDCISLHFRSGVMYLSNTIICLMGNLLTFSTLISTFLWMGFVALSYKLNASAVPSSCISIETILTEKIGCISFFLLSASFLSFNSL